MGGFGALSAAFQHPNVFGVVGAHSSSLRVDDGTLTILGTGDEYKAKDPISIAASAPGLDRLQIYIDSGQEDPWFERDVELHNILTLRGVPHIWQANAGGHEYQYWMEHILDYLRFYGNALVRQ
jgi:enterochelin esterase-like enzyme